MKTTLNLGQSEKVCVHIERNQFTGRFFYIEEGETKILRSPTGRTTHFPTERNAYYHFSVGKNEKYDIRILHSWPERFPAFKKQTYEIYVNGELLKTIRSY